MEPRARPNRAEAALERLLQRIDDAVDEYARTRRFAGRMRRATPWSDEPVDWWDDWWALPLTVRDWLLWYVPRWWMLEAGTLRRFLLTAARLIARNHLGPRRALRRAAAQLRLPPMRPRTATARAAARRALRVFRAAALRHRPPTRASAAPARRRPARARPVAPARSRRAAARRVPALRTMGGRRSIVRR